MSDKETEQQLRDAAWRAVKEWEQAGTLYGSDSLRRRRCANDVESALDALIAWHRADAVREYQRSGIGITHTAGQ